MTPGFNWQALTALILNLSKVAMDWYRLVSGDPNGDRVARKVVSIVLDPDRPEQTPEEVDLGR